MLYTLAAVAIVQGFITLIDGLRAARHMRTFRPSGATRDRVIVFCPCKGIDSEFGKNIRSILGQDYPNFEARFVVESEADPACRTLRQLGINDVLVAGYANDRGQKVHNLAYAVARAAEAAGARIVFVPECLVPSYGECGWRELFEFTTRQITITRVYHPRLWRISFMAQLIFNAAFIALPFSRPVLWLTIYAL